MLGVRAPVPGSRAGRGPVDPGGVRGRPGPGRGAAVSGVGGGAAASTSCPWVTSKAPIAQRVAQLMSQMSLADKITMVEGHGTSNPYVFYTPAIPALCIPAVGLEDGPAGVADGLTGVTQLPAGVALAAAWDPSLAEQYGQVIGAEEYGKGASANLGPTVNIDPDPRRAPTRSSRSTPTTGWRCRPPSRTGPSRSAC